jgi:hypothetical protein
MQASTSAPAPAIASAPAPAPAIVESVPAKPTAATAGAGLWPLLRATSADKLVDSPLFNRLGGQVARMVAAHALRRLARRRAPAQVRHLCQALDTHGMLRLPEFLEPATFARVRQAALRALEQYGDRCTTYEQGSTRTELLNVRLLAEADQDALRPWFEHPALMQLVSWAESRRLSPHDPAVSVERVRHEVCPGRDMESDLHSDIFFSSHKAWLYLDDVGPHNGVLSYVPGSHHVSLGRIPWEYRNSVGARHGSRRISERELAELGLREQVITCPANTLVIANTCGYHRRIPGAREQRRALVMNLRFGPFEYGWTRRRRPPAGRPLAAATTAAADT